MVHSPILTTAGASPPVEPGDLSMRLISLAASIGITGLIALAVAADKDKPAPAAKAQTGTAGKTDVRAAPEKTAQKEAEAAISESARRFVAAYNRHDAKSIAAGFTTTAEFITEDGTTLEGRQAIERHFVAAFAAAPKAHLELKVESVRLIKSDVAVEEGRVEFTAAPGAAVESSRYVALHVNMEGKWLLARARDFPAEPEVQSNYEHLRELEWLVGEWIQEDEATLIATSCKWVDRRNFLLQEFTIRIGSLDPITGSTRIGWDPQTQQIKSWTFDSDGGYSEALWSRGENRWVLKARGVTRSGRIFSGTSIVRQVDAGTMSWESHDRVEGGVLVPDRPPIVIKRRPPPPGE
jgi:uncharacterized protein (TIGR02246 family)